MKFGAQFEANIVAEWEEHYCRYKYLKHLIGRLFPTKIKKKKAKKDHKRSLSSGGKGLSSSLQGDHTSGGTFEDSDRKRGSTGEGEDKYADGEGGAAGGGEGGGGDEEGDDHDPRAEYIINYGSDDVADRATYFGAPAAPLRSAEERREEVMRELTAELDKVDRWYTMVERELIKTFEAIRSQIEALVDAHSVMAAPEHLGSAAAVGEHELEKERLTTVSEGERLTDDEAAILSDGGAPMEPMGASAQPPPPPERIDVVPTYHEPPNPAAAVSARVHSAHFTKEAHDLKHSCIRLLRKADRLVNFVAMNTQAFEKLVKNFQKRSEFNVKDEFLAEMRSRDFVKSHEIDENLIPATFDLFVRHFEDGNVEQAHTTLLAKIPQTKEYSRKDYYLFGVKCGVILIMTLWIFLHLVDPIPDPPHSTPAPSIAPTIPIGGGRWDMDVDVANPVFRFVGLLTLAVWLWGGMIYLWSKYRVSYVFLFEFNPRTRLTHFQVFDEAANITIFYLLNALLYLSHHELYLGHRVPHAIYPLAILLFVVLKLLVPIAPFAHWASRWSLLESLWNIVKAPFGRIRFRDEFIADYLTSVIKIIADWQLTCCFYFIETPFGTGACSNVSIYVLPIVSGLPFWWRMAQCLRLATEDPKRRSLNLLNALKYSLGIAVVVMGAFHPHATLLFTHGHPFRVIWVLLIIVMSVAFFLWDVVVDWGLFTFDPDSTSPLLRTQLMFHRPAYYYLAIITNFVLRFGWAMTIIPFTWQSLPVLHSFNRLHALPLLIAIELLRRTMWGLLTVENQHLQHSARLRNSRIMPVLFDQNNPDTDFKRRLNTVTGYNGVVEALILVGIIVAADLCGQMIGA